MHKLPPLISVNRQQALGGTQLVQALSLETRPRQQQIPIVILSFFGQMDGFELCLVAYFFFSDLLTTFFTGARGRGTLAGTGRSSVISHKLHVYLHIPVYFMVKNWMK